MKKTAIRIENRQSHSGDTDETNQIQAWNQFTADPHGN